MKTEIRSSNERTTITVVPIRGLRSLREAERALQRAQFAVATHQQAALTHALRAGAILHYAKSQVKQNGEWSKWLALNFDGSQNRAGVYIQIARAYSAAAQKIDACESIEDALQIARELPKPTDLPPYLPGLMEAPKLRVVQKEHEIYDVTIRAEGEDECVPGVVGVTRAEARAAISEAIERNEHRVAELEADEEAQAVKAADERNHQIDAEFELMVHPDTAAGNAARKAEKLLTNAVATYGTPESAAFADKALALMRTHALEVLVVSHV